MKPRPSNWVLILTKAGRRLDVFKLGEGTAILGRDPSNDIPLPHTSVSRRHAEIVCGPSGVEVRDLSSRNGVLVNGVPRKSAALQPGDKLTICDFVLELATSAPIELEVGEGVASGLAAALRVDQTVEQRVRLPEARPERDLAALYHVCFWVAEGVEERIFVDKCIGLLIEAFRAEEVQLYSGDQKLIAAQTVDGGKARVKLAAFLAKQFQEFREATIVPGAGIARHQRGVGDYNYLVSPLRSGSAAAASTAVGVAVGAAMLSPFVVVLRPADQSDFSADDRVLLQAIAQLWTRGVARSHQLVELRQQNEALKEKVGGGVILGRSPAMLELLARARKAAATNATILITGETGSGKEVLAQFLHENSARRNGPLVKLNCAAIPDSLIESELFGYAKGAFSGATRDHHGRFVQSHNGTLFLDEIGEMPLAVQAKVLRAIENREIQPLGSEETIQVDLRIIAATHRDLATAVRERTFREDLYYRLDVQNLQLPPLRERPEDLPELVEHFLRRTCAENGLAAITFAPEALDALGRHDWPGNVRELWNVVQRCALAAESLIVSAPEAQAQIRRPTVDREGSR